MADLKSNKKLKLQYNGTDIVKLFTSVRKGEMGSFLKDKKERIKKLLGQVENVNEVDPNDNNNTLLHIAASMGYQEIVELLVSVGADISIQNRSGKIPLDLANDLPNSNPQKTVIIEMLKNGKSDLSSIVRPETLVNKHHGTYSASGLKLTLHGTIYQLKLLMLFLNRGLKKGYNFRLATEWNDAEKFDDLVFKYTDSKGRVKYRFLQAKHKLDEDKKITVGDLLTQNRHGEFNLEKYFVSYFKIKKNKGFKDGDLEDFIICTNIDFDLGSSVQGQIRKLKTHSGKHEGKEILVKVIDTDDDFLQDNGTRYKLENSSNLTSYLTQSDEARKEIHEQSIGQEAEEFLANLVFAVNQPNETILDKIIGKEIGEKFSLIDYDLISHDFQTQMLDWMKEKGLKGEEGRFLSVNDGRKFFDFIEEKVSKVEMIGPTSRYSIKLKQFDVFFKDSSLAKVENFLNQDKKQILNLTAQQGTRLSAIKVNQVLHCNSLYNSKDSFIFMSLINILRLQDKVLKAFQSKNTGNLLVIECKNKKTDDVQDLYMRLKSIVKDNINKNMSSN